MNALRDPDARIAAFFEASQPNLPDRTFDAVRRDIHRTRQLIVVGPLREPESILAVRVAAVVALAIGITLMSLRPSVGPGGALTPTTTPSVALSPTVSPTGPMVFTSLLYGYTVRLPAGWISAPALRQWDGARQPGPDAVTDQFDGPAGLSAWAFAGPFSGDLADFVTDRIAANARDHADTCPVNTPEVNEPLRIGGQQWVLLGWNCGALINQAVTVRTGMAYAFTFRDFAIKAANDPADRALFQSILDSVELPD